MAGFLLMSSVLYVQQENKAVTKEPEKVKVEKVSPTITENSLPNSWLYVYQSQADMLLRQAAINAQYGAANVTWISFTSSNQTAPCDGCPTEYYWKIKYQIVAR